MMVLGCWGLLEILEVLDELSFVLHFLGVALGVTLMKLLLLRICG